MGVTKTMKVMRIWISYYEILVVMMLRITRYRRGRGIGNENDDLYILGGVSLFLCILYNPLRGPCELQSEHFLKKVSWGLM